jgi:endonuclease III
LKNEGTYTKKFNGLLRKIKTAHRGQVPDEVEPVTQLIISFLEYNATRSMASKAFENVMAQMVDINDLRITLPKELIAIIGDGYPEVQERIVRMRESLYEIYRREHCVSMESIRGRNKKQVANYLQTLPGMVPYVSSQVMLLNYGFHAVPIDDRMAEMLRSEGVVDEHSTTEDISHFIERLVKSGDGVAVHAAMRAWADRKSQTLVTAAKDGEKRKKTTKTPPQTRKKK